MKSIAIFDYRVSPTNPIGGCHRKMLSALYHEYDFTVFAVEFDNPAPAQIAFQRVPVPRRPLALLFVTYHLLAPICYWIHRIRHRKRFDVVQMVESNLSFGTIAFAHFCHKAYLRLRVAGGGRPSLRQWLRGVDHRLHAMLEPWTYSRVKHIIVPSQGIADELAREYPKSRGKIRVVHNPVDTESMRRPPDFNREIVRFALGWTNEDVVLIFVALGHFERKGLPILLEALKQLDKPWLKLLVVGGEQGLVTEYENRACRAGLRDRIAFTGNCGDIRPYLWSADAFVLASHYETFSLAAVEAAAAGLPIIAPLLYGIEEWLGDGTNGLVIEQTSESLASALTRFLALDQAAVQEMGARAAHDVRRFGREFYAPRWRKFYDALQKSSDGLLA